MFNVESIQRCSLKVLRIGHVVNSSSKADLFFITDGTQ